MHWRLQEPVHQQARYWSPNQEYSVSNIRIVNMHACIHNFAGPQWIQGRFYSLIVSNWISHTDSKVHNVICAFFQNSATCKVINLVYMLPSTMFSPYPDLVTLNWTFTSAKLREHCLPVPLPLCRHDWCWVIIFAHTSNFDPCFAHTLVLMMRWKKSISNYKIWMINWWAPVEATWCHGI